MATPTLPLKTAPRTSVFRALLGVIGCDPTLRRIFGKPGSLRVWDGSTEDAADFALVQAPAARFTPMSGGVDDWFSPEMQFGDLVVGVELLVRGTNVDDVMNLWWAIQRAIYPETPDGPLAIANKLMAAGATTGMVTFIEPAFDPDAARSNGYFLAYGRMKVEIREILNP